MQDGTYLFVALFLQATQDLGKIPDNTGGDTRLELDKWKTVENTRGYVHKCKQSLRPSLLCLSHTRTANSLPCLTRTHTANSLPRLTHTCTANSFAPHTSRALLRETSNTGTQINNAILTSNSTLQAVYIVEDCMERHSMAFHSIIPMSIHGAPMLS